MAYMKQNFSNGNVLTAEQLNHMENGIAYAHEQLKNLQEGAGGGGNTGGGNTGGGSTESLGVSKRYFRHAGIITAQGVVDISPTNGGKSHTDIIPIDTLADGPEGWCVQDFDADYTAYPKVLFFSGDTLDTLLYSYTYAEIADKITHKDNVENGIYIDALTAADILSLASFDAKYVAFNSDYEEEAMSEDFVYVRGPWIELDETLTYEGRAADAKAVGDAVDKLARDININKNRLAKLEEATIRAVYTAAEMDEILEYAASEPDEGWFYYTGEYYYMYVGETTEKYAKGAVYKLKGVV